MTRLVSPDRIESLVGRVRHATAHYARAVPIEGNVDSAISYVAPPFQNNFTSAGIASVTKDAWTAIYLADLERGSQ